MSTNFKHFPPRTDLTEKLTEKEYRAAFVQEEIRRGLPFQIRAIREARGMNQQQLGEAAGIPQANISRIENTRNAFLSVPTLLKIAEAYDVALIVKFAPFSELEEWATLPLSEMVPADHALDATERASWEASQPATDKVSEMMDFLFASRQQGMNEDATGSEELRMAPRKGFDELKQTGAIAWKR